MPLTSVPNRVPGNRRVRVVLGVAVACAFLALGATSAQARTVTICASRATLYETPGGAKVGILHAGDRVRVIAEGGDDPWWRVAARFGTRGWLRESAICRRDR
ncbi:MAG TPA: SH3 domain-containing protein [Baekduia sp.]|nr:SH3 domain-containing protein [Baekduia sp.]